MAGRVVDRTLCPIVVQYLENPHMPGHCVWVKVRRNSRNCCARSDGVLCLRRCRKHACTNLSEAEYNLLRCHRFSQIFDRANKKLAGVAVPDANCLVVPACQCNSVAYARLYTQLCPVLIGPTSISPLSAFRIRIVPSSDPLAI